MMRFIRPVNRLARVLMALGLAATVQAAAKPPADLSGPRGETVKAFLAMLNDGGPEAVRVLEEKYRSPAKLKTTPMDERIARVKQMHGDWGAITLHEVTGAADNSLTITAETTSGMSLEMEFMFEAAADGKLDGVKIMAQMGKPASGQTITAEQRAATLEAACQALEQNYVYPEVAAKMAASVRAKLKSGAYDKIDNDTDFSHRLTDDLRAVSHDLHLGVRVQPNEGGPARHGGGLMDSGARDNYLFRKVEILPGNIGYLKLDGFLWNDEAKRKAASSMEFLSDADALIVDLRTNGGGEPEMIRFLTTYLFDEPTHLNDMVDRDGKVVQEFWTLKDFSGHRLRKDTPVFVLVSSRTFSGAEEFAYNLKSLKRGTIVGETTGGGAHPVRPERINDRIVLMVPFMRACNPITKTNWEGKGVEPDVAVPADQALEKALELARK